MSSFGNLAMSADIAKDNRISISKSLFGLLTKVVYSPTQSPVAAKKRELDAEKGGLLEKAINSPAAKRVEALVAFGHVPDTTLGNYLLEVCHSSDSQYLSLRLYRFIQMRYEPVSEICTFDGADAQKVIQAIV